MSDAWESPEAGLGTDDGGEGLGVPTYGQGSFVNQVYSVDNIFRLGLAALQEQPALVLLGGFNVFVVQLLPQFASLPLQFGIGMLGGSSALDPAVVEALGQVSGALVSLLFLPLQHVIMAGVMVAVAGYVVSGTSSVSALYTSFAAGLRVLLYSLCMVVVMLGVALVVFAPAALAGGLLFYMDQPLAGSVAAGLLGMIALIPLMYVSLGLQLGMYAAALDDLGPVAAMNASWQAASGARIILFVTTFVFGMLGVLSCCLFMLPVIVLSGIQIAGFSAAWLLYARSSEETRRWGFVERNWATPKA